MKTSKYMQDQDMGNLVEKHLETLPGGTTQLLDRIRRLVNFIGNYAIAGKHDTASRLD